MKVKNKPVVGIAGLVNHHPQDTAFKEYERHFCNEAFVMKIREAGGVPLLVPYIDNFTDEMIEDYISSIDSLLLPGGGDIEPSLYGEEKIEQCGKTDITLDLFHIALIKECKAQGKPILGICRGYQLMNVAFGGTMYQDLGIFNKYFNHSDLKTYSTTSHSVKIVENTKLNKIINLDEVRVNSLHHQALKDIAPSMIVSAESEDGVIEAIESLNKDTFIVGVQWHPETMIENKDIMNKLFEAFVDSSKF